MKQKKQSKSLKRQLISGGIYIALSALAASVAINGAVKIISSKTDNLPLPHDSVEELAVPELEAIPEIPYPAVMPENMTLGENYGNEAVEDTENSALTVSDTVDGIPANDISDNTQSTPSSTPSDVISVTQPSSDCDNGSESCESLVFTLPCQGFVTKGHSVDIPVYSATLYDYRIHNGIDIACEKGTFVKAVCDGTVTDICSDNELGITVTMEGEDGYVIKYCNLDEALPLGIEKNTAVSGGTIIASVGETALAECGDASHLHLEIYKDGVSVDPEELLDF